MRLIISSSGMMVIIILLVIIHNSIISDNYCNMEMNSSINGAFDYALDKVMNTGILIMILIKRYAR